MRIGIAAIALLAVCMASAAYGKQIAYWMPGATETYTTDTASLGLNFKAVGGQLEFSLHDRANEKTFVLTCSADKKTTDLAKLSTEFADLLNKNDFFDVRIFLGVNGFEHCH